jgi:hypothetical protein
LVRASDCGSESRGFETHLPPKDSFDFSKESFFKKQYQLFTVAKIFKENKSIPLRKYPLQNPTK